MPPFVVFNRKTLSKELCVGEVPGTMYGLSQNGWVDSELFDLWFSNHFLAHAVPTRPLLLIMNGASSHLNPLTIQKAAQKEVVLFCLPPHSTHKTQPLDKGCFGPLKTSWREECHFYLAAHPGKVVTQYQFSELFKNSWIKSMTMRNIISGFRVTGTYPFNPDIINPPPPPETEPSASASSKVKFLPLCSPMPRRSLSVSVLESSSDEEMEDLDVCTFGC